MRFDAARVPTVGQPTLSQVNAADYVSKSLDLPQYVVGFDVYVPEGVTGVVCYIPATPSGNEIVHLFGAGTTSVRSGSIRRICSVEGVGVEVTLMFSTPYIPAPTTAVKLDSENKFSITSTDVLLVEQTDTVVLAVTEPDDTLLNVFDGDILALP